LTATDEQSERFERLCAAPLHEFGPLEWSIFYKQVAPYLLHPDSDVRTRTVERLSMAVMRAERMPRPQRVTDEQAVLRLSWLIDRLLHAHQQHRDIVPAFLSELRHHGHYEPFRTPLREWLRGLKTHSLDAVREEIVEGTLILLGDCGRDWEEAAPKCLALLDDPSNYVRACAARMLSESCDATTQPDTDELLEIIKAKEVIRPGIAGPFWSYVQFEYDGSIDITEWMLQILEQRLGPEPNDLPFNGVDFYLHERCGRSSRAIERMLQSGHKALAIAAATQTPGVVEDMQEILLMLGDDADPELARRAWQHLARYYHCLHPKAQQCAEILGLPQWAPGVDAMVIRQTSGGTLRDVMVLYPALAQPSIDHQKTWELIDRTLPPALRGDVVPNSIDRSRGPARLGSNLLYEFASGAIVILDGFPDRGLWTRLEIIGRGLQGRWDPRSMPPAA
jgi:hypothetical protein